MFPNTTTLHSSHQFLWKIFGAQYIPNFCAPRCSFLCGNGAAKLVYDLKRFISFAPSAMEGSIFFFLAPFSTAEVSESWTVLLGSLQAVNEASGPFLSRWLRHCKGGGQVQTGAP